MDAAAFEQVDKDFQDFHAYFGPLFGRREARDQRRHYLQALPVQSGGGATPRICRRRFRRQPGRCSGFTPNPPWNDDVVMGRLQEYLGPRLGHPEAVWVLDGSDFPKQDRKSVGVAR